MPATIPPDASKLVVIDAGVPIVLDVSGLQYTITAAERVEHFNGVTALEMPPPHAPAAAAPFPEATPRPAD